MAGVKRRIYTDLDIHALHKELDEVSCPICMDHPHNAVLILCSSHEKGCRSYICDTSYRHSNCLDRFKKLKADSANTSDMNLPFVNDLNDEANTNERDNLNERNMVTSFGLPGRQGETYIADQDGRLVVPGEDVLATGDFESFQGRIEPEELHGETVGVSSESKLNLKCPMCRGDILGWEVLEEARKYLNLKKRTCSRDSCTFSGNYLELRRHARRVHPTSRPSDVDPSRARAWQRIEHQREYGDIVSAIQSAMPGAMVVGDYAIENSDRLSIERGNGSGEANGPLWTTFFLFQMIGSGDSEPRARSRAWTRHRRPAGTLSGRRFLWGENLLGLQGHDDDDEGDLHILSDASEDASPIPRRRRRLTRSRSDEDQS